MSDSNKSYRIRTDINSESPFYLNVNLNQDYKNFEILSLNLDSESLYKMYTSEYGCIVGRVLANDALGVPNAKISVFIPTKESDDIDPVLRTLYPYESTFDKNEDKIRYNTLPDEIVNACHQSVGTFPNKRLVLDDNNILEIFDKYYKYSTVSNESGDYMIFGVPVGDCTVHVDIDLSDIGDLSQRPIDMMYKGYDVSQFESSSMFKKSTDIDSLTQIISQNAQVYVKPFWGNDESQTVSITRNDISIHYKFEPTCVFIGSVITDGSESAISKRCVPSADMGEMRNLKGSAGTIEMIRKTPQDNVESFTIQGTKLIDGSGTWCYQIPMNLDFIGTDEYGNRVATNDPNKGVPTRTRVRFRLSLSDNDVKYDNIHLTKVLIPNNPQKEGETDYAFGSYTKDDEIGSKSFRDLFSNNIYTVKSYIPRIQKGSGQRTSKFTGIKNITVNNGNNEIPYNNMRVNITFMFTLQCAILKVLIFLVSWLNQLLSGDFWYFLYEFIYGGGKEIDMKNQYKWLSCISIGDAICPDMEGWYFAPGCDNKEPRTIGNAFKPDPYGGYTALQRTAALQEWGNKNNMDSKSIDFGNDIEGGSCLVNDVTYLMQCVEISLAMEHNVVQFDFYNDWLNGTIYMPKWFGNVKPKKTRRNGTVKRPEQIQACMEDTFINTRNLVQQCAIEYGVDPTTGYYTLVKSNNGCFNTSAQKQVCHKKQGRKTIKIFGPKNGGIVHKEMTMQQDYVYYMRPCEWKENGGRIILFATDIVLLGSLDIHNKQGVPVVFDHLKSSTYKLPPLIAATNLEDDNRYSACANTLTDEEGETNPASLNNNLSKNIEVSAIDVFHQNVCIMEPYLSNVSVTTGEEYTTVKKIDNVSTIGCIIRPVEYGILNLNWKDKYMYFSVDVKPSVDSIMKIGVEFASSSTNGNFSEAETINVKQGEWTTLHSSYKCPINLTTDLALELKIRVVTANSVNVNSNFLFRNWYIGMTGEESYDGIEYKITEMSGIDWGYQGPGQGNSRFSDLYYPGGHFLGISCFNAETNIKTCVNLSRACEYGTSFSEFMSLRNEDGETFISYQPNGLISKKEITNDIYRNIFATLNHNNLITVEDINLQRKYDFISKLSYLFDGTLKENVDNASYTNSSVVEPMYDDTSEPEVVYNNSFENFDIEYYRFRFGLDNKNQKQREYCFLVSKDNKKSFPLYENSFYFYFGIDKGNTAYDRLYSDYNSICTNDVNALPAIEVTVVDNNEICDPLSGDTCEDIIELNGTVLIRINNLESAYKMTLYRNGEEDAIGLSMALKNNKVYYRPCGKTTTGRTENCASTSANCVVNTNSIYDEFYIENLLEGNYELYITTFDNSYLIVKEFEVLRESLADFPEINEMFAKIYTVDFKNVYSPISRDSNNTSREGYICLPLIDNTEYVAYWKVRFKINGNYYDFEIQNNTLGLIYIGEIEGKQYNVYIEDESQIKKVYVPFGDTDYFVIAMYACDGSYREIKDDGSYYINYDELNTEVYFNALEDKEKEPVSGRLIRNCLSDGSNDIETIIDKQWYLNDKLVNLPNIEDSKLNPDPTLTMLIMDMSLVCQDSLFGRQTGLYNGSSTNNYETGYTPCEFSNKISFYIKKRIINEENGTVSMITEREGDMEYKGHIENKNNSLIEVTNDVSNLNTTNGPNFEDFKLPTYIFGDAYYMIRLNSIGDNVEIVVDGEKVKDSAGTIVNNDNLSITTRLNYEKIKDYEIEF